MDGPPVAADQVQPVSRRVDPVTLSGMKVDRHEELAIGVSAIDDALGSVRVPGRRDAGVVTDADVGPAVRRWCAPRVQARDRLTLVGDPQRVPCPVTGRGQTDQYSIRLPRR